MQLRQTQEPLEQEDYKIFYDEFKKEFYTTVVYALIFHGVGFVFLIAFWGKGWMGIVLVYYILFASSIWKKIYHLFLYYKRVYRHPHKTVWKGKITEKTYKIYLIKSEKQEVPVFIFPNQEELIVSPEAFNKFNTNDMVVLYSLINEDEFFRYELL